MSVRIFGAMRGLKDTGVLVAVLWYYDIDRPVLVSEKPIGEERRPMFMLGPRYSHSTSSFPART